MVDGWNPGWVEPKTPDSLSRVMVEPIVSVCWSAMSMALQSDSLTWTGYDNGSRLGSHPRAHNDPNMSHRKEEGGDPYTLGLPTHTRELVP